MPLTPLIITDLSVSYGERPVLDGIDLVAQPGRRIVLIGENGVHRRVGTLSGGQRTRLALATIMTTRPTCLLLDEPTNHLDDDALAVLGDFLSNLPGGWSDYQEHRRRARERWESTYAQQQEELKALRAASTIGTDAIAHNRGPRDNDKYIYSFKGGNVARAHARRKRDAEQRLEAAEKGQVRKPRPLLTFSARLTDDQANGRVVLVRDMEVAGRLRLDRLDVRPDVGQRPPPGGWHVGHQKIRLAASCPSTTSVPQTRQGRPARP